jgi:hypothetical protein
VAGDTDLIVDAPGPDPLVVLFEDRSIEVTVPDDPLTVEFLAVGLPGRDGQDGADGAGADIEAVASADLIAGMPVAIDRATAKFIAGDAAWKPAAFVAGLLRARTSTGFVGAAATSN